MAATYIIKKDSYHILVIVGYPSLLYFANQIHFSNRFLDWLGSLSFPIYAFQCILRVVEACGFENNTWLFVILMILVLSYSFVVYAIRRKRSKHINDGGKCENIT